MQNITFAASETVITDSDAQWKLNWNWERNQEGFEWISSEISTENGLKLTVDDEKFDLFNTYKYACTSGDGETKLENPSGEYKYFIRLDADGNPVHYDADDKTSKRVMIYHQGRNNYSASFNAGETGNNGEAIVLSYDFDITTLDNQYWNAPKLSFMGFNIFHDVAGKFRIAHNGGNLDIEKDKNINKHSVSYVIAPAVEGGRYHMTAVMLDGELIQLNNIYSTTSGKTDADCYLTDMTFTFYIGKGRSAEINNLKVVRGFDDIVLSTDFIEGSEIGDNGIAISSSTKLVSGTMDGKIKVYDCDFDDELIADPGVVINYTADGMGANVRFTKLEGGGNYRMELTGVVDMWGNEYKDTFSVAFSTPDNESGGGDIDDTPDEEAGSNEISVGEIQIGSSNTLYHGHGFFKASKSDDMYEVMIDTDAWFEAEDEKYGKENYYYYLDEDGSEKLLGYGNDSWNHLELDIKTDETVNTNKPVVVSYEWYGENLPAVSEWGAYYMNIMGMYFYLSDYTADKTMLKVYQNGTTALPGFSIEPTADNWHSMKVVISPVVTEGRSKLEAVIIDGKITFIEDAYSNLATYDDSKLILDRITMHVPKPSEGTANVGDSFVKLRNIQAMRVDGIEAEMFMPLGVQNPKEPLKLNFNYQIEDELKAEDFSIYEITDETDADGKAIEKQVLNKITVSKEYDGKQVLIDVGEGGLYYNKNYKLVINKNIIVEDYITLVRRECEFSTYEYPDELTAELTRVGNKINYNISGGGDSFLITVSTYDETGALVGFNPVTAEKEGAGNRQKARGSVEIVNASSDESVLVSIFTGDGTMKLYRLPTEF